MRFTGDVVNKLRCPHRIHSRYLNLKLMMLSRIRIGDGMFFSTLVLIESLRVFGFEERHSGTTLSLSVSSFADLLLVADAVVSIQVDATQSRASM